MRIGVMTLHGHHRDLRRAGVRSSVTRNSAPCADRVRSQLQVSEVLVQLLEDLQHERAITVIAPMEKRSQLVVHIGGSLVELGYEPSETFAGRMEQYRQLGDGGGRRELALAVALHLAPQPNMLEPERRRRARVHDERRSTVRAVSMGPDVHRGVVETIQCTLHAGQRLLEIRHDRARPEIHPGQR